MRPKTEFYLIALAGIIFVLLPGAMADGYIPTKTTVYFEQDEKPFDGQVSFSVSCYGYVCHDAACSPEPGYSERDSHNAEVVFSYSASCPGYGCAIYEPFYVNHRHIAWCDMTGTANGTPFSLPNVSASPIPDCTYRRQYDAVMNNTYYRYPPEYQNCIDNTKKNRTEVCSRYLIPSTWSAIENTSGVSWVADNGTYWIRTPEYLSCLARIDRESLDCKSEYSLEPVDPASFETDPAGHAIGNFCNLRVALSPYPSPVAQMPAPPTKSNKSALNETTPGSHLTQVPAGRFLIDEISCWFAGLSGGGCH